MFRLPALSVSRPLRCPWFPGICAGIRGTNSALACVQLLLILSSLSVYIYVSVLSVSSKVPVYGTEDYICLI